MSDNSLLLLAVKRSMAYGKEALKGGNAFSSFYGISSLEQATVPMSSMNDYIDVLVDECVEKLPSSLQGFRQQVVDTLREAQDFETYLYGDDSNTFCNTFYNDRTGKISVFVYLFVPNDAANTVKSEYMSIDLSFRLADIAVTLTRMKKRFLRRKKVWTEIRYIKPAVKFTDFIVALSMCISPLIDTSLGVSTPDGLVTELKNHANSVPDTIPSDTPRRTVYNPLTKMNVVVESEEVLKLIPGRWEVVTSEIFENAQNSNTYWEFDE
jgi:hypothetical protein